MTSTHDLKRALPWWQIVLLAISGIIGVTIFSTIGTVLHEASTAGTLIALGIVGLVAICVMSSLGELVVLWPVPNALVEYVRYFIDEDIATVVGVTYWYTWSSVFTVLLIAAYDFLCVLIERQEYRVGIMFGIGLLLVIINGLGVKLYGWIEAIGGLIKFLNAIAGGVFLCIALHKQHAANDPAFGYNSNEARNGVVAVCMAIPTLTYGFLGVEIVAITAFEALDRRSLRWPTRWIAWIMTTLYFFVAIPGTILIYWQDQYLSSHTTTSAAAAITPALAARSTVDLAPPPAKCTQTYPYLVLAAFEYGSVAAGKYFNICIIYFCVSSANTALYVASRTLYGIFRPFAQGRPRPLPWWQQFRDLPRYLGMVSSSQVPVSALLVSSLSWSWLVGLRAVKFDVLGLMSTIGSIGGVMVWFIECCAFISYFAWLRNTDLPDTYDRHSRAFQWQRQRPWLSSLQPFVAWTGAVGCFAIGLVLCSAPWWRGTKTESEIAGVYAGPAAMLILFLGLKTWRRYFGRQGATRAEGREIYTTLEDLSGLPLDREARVPDDDERTFGEDLVVKIRSLFPQRTQKNQVVESTELQEARVTGSDRNGVSQAEPVTGVIRQRTLELLMRNSAT